MIPTDPRQYCPEIDGLRAIAVLSVVLYHFGVPALRGGFVGVDIFFVISGFLIGGLLWREGQSTGRISLGNFYVRRIKRLAPAYVAMALASLLVGYLVLLPFEYREFGKSLIAATVYLSNVHFFREAGYFDSASEDKTLLHTWSLSVEEQFYIFLPLVMILLLRRTYILRPLLWGLFAASLIACVVITPKSQTAAFYLFPFRAWELLAGVLLAIEAQRKSFRFSQQAAISYAGLAITLGAILFIPSGNTFPGALAIAPTLGAVLLIANGQHPNAVNRALASPYMVSIGLISYSLYLWHWPVLTLSRYYRGSYSGPLETALWMLLSLAIAYLSWRFIERPVRHAKSFGPIPTFSTAILASFALIGAGGILYKQDGLLGRFHPPIKTHIEASADFLQDWSRCHWPSSGAFQGLEICPIGPDGAPQTLIWGDSHVRALKEGLEQAAFEANIPALVIWRAGCAPVFGLTKTENSATPAQDAQCTAANAILQTALADGPFKSVLLVGRWGYYLNGTGTGRDKSNTISLSVDGQTGSQAMQFLAGLSDTVQSLENTGTDVYLLSAIPEIKNYDSRYISRALAGHRLTEAELQSAISVPSEEAQSRSQAIQTALASSQATLLDPAPFFCTGKSCSALFEGRAQYFDNNHIVNTAARRIRHLFDPVWPAP